MSAIVEGYEKMTPPDTYLTAQGRVKLTVELDHLRNVKRQEIGQRLHETAQTSARLG